MLPMAVPAPRRPDPPLAISEPEPAALPRRAVERRLVRGAQRGSAEDFEALFALHWPRAYRTAWLVVHDAAAAEDIAQEAFIAALRALDSFDRRRPFGPWLSRIVVNRAIDWARARRLQAVPAESVAPVAPPAEGWSEEIVVALRSLPVDQRAVVVLRHGLGYTPGEIARMLDLPRGTVNSRLRRALDRLETLLEGESRWSLSGSTSCCADRRPARRRRASGRALRIAEELAQRPAGRRPRGRVAAVAAAAAVLALAAALSPPGEAVADWVRTAVGLRSHAPAPSARAAGDRLPSGGRLLVSSGGSTWIVEADGKRRRLGAWTGASWSPHARFVVVWRGRRLAAVDRRGRVRWSLQAPRPVTGRGVVAERLPRRLPLRPGPARGRGRRHRRPPARSRHVPADGVAAGPRARARLPLGRAHRHRRRRPAPPARPHPPPPCPARARVVRGRAPAVRQPPPLAGDLRRERPAHRPDLDAGSPDRLDLRPPAQRHARRGRAPRRDRAGERGRADGAGGGAAGAVPRRRAASRACGSPRRGAGCWSHGRPQTSGSSCARARPAHAACSPRRTSRGGWARPASRRSAAGAARRT